MENKLPEVRSNEQLINLLIDKFKQFYWQPLHDYLINNPHLITEFPGLLMEPEQVILYLGQTHLAIEYVGPEKVREFSYEGTIHVKFFDYSNAGDDFVNRIVGFNYDSSSTANLKIPLPPFSDEWILPTNAGLDKLIELKWNFAAQNAMIGMNTNGMTVIEGQFSRLVNGLFFHADESGLKTRHIKWIDFLPIQSEAFSDYDNIYIAYDILADLVEQDAHYSYPLPLPEDYKFTKLPKINRFLELISNNMVSEPDITSFLAQTENRFILTMALSATEIYSEVECQWQSEATDNIRPDFFVKKANGYCDIVEFKLPYLKGAALVGRTNRESFSAEINSYISQTRKYRTYFEDPNNRRWLESTHNIKVQYPRRILVVGRRWDFSSDDWREIMNDFRDLDIMTYEDLVDSVVAQFYQ